MTEQGRTMKESYVFDSGWVDHPDPTTANERLFSTIYEIVPENGNEIELNGLRLQKTGREHNDKRFQTPIRAWGIPKDDIVDATSIHQFAVRDEHGQEALFVGVLDYGRYMTLSRGFVAATSETFYLEIFMRLC